MKVIDNRYKLDNLLEEDIEGNSYLVTDLWNTDKIWKLKFYDFENQGDIIDYFIDEFVFISKIKHENLLSSEEFNIVKSIDGKRLRLHQYYSITEYEDSPTLEEEIENMSMEEKIFVVLQLLIVVDFLHFRGIIYKHLTPTNIFITKDHIVKLRDLANISTQIIEKNYDTVDRYFIAPEVLLKTEDTNKKVDYYSLSMLLKYIFEGKFYEKSKYSFNFNNDCKLDEQKKLFLKELYTKLRMNNQINNLQQSIKDMIDIFNIDYEYDIFKERGTLNFKTKIVGRDKELKKIFNIRDQFQKNNYANKLFLISGEEGIGKTRLLREVEYRLKFRSKVVYNLAVEEENRIDSKLFCKILKQTIKDAPKNLINRYGSELVKLIPELSYGGGITPSSNLSEDKEKFKLYYIVTNYIKELAMINPIYILIDDIHNIDEWSMGLIEYMINKLGACPILIIATCDQNKGKKENFKVLKKWMTSDKTQSVILSNFGLQEVSEMVQHILGISYKPLSFSTVLLDESSGNPGYIEFIIKSLFAVKELYIDKNGFWYVKTERYADLYYPASFDEGLKNQINTLDAEHKKVVQVISIFNYPVTKDILLKLIDIGKKELEQIINKLLTMKLLDERLGDWGYSYKIYNRHLKKIIYSEIPEKERVKLHRKTAEIFRTDYTNNSVSIMEELTYHLIMSGQVDVAVDCLINQAAKLETLLSSQALCLLEKAYELLEDKEVSYKKLELAESIGKHYTYKGEYDKALDMYNKILKDAEKIQNIKYIVNAYNSIGDIYIRRGQDELAKQYAFKGQKTSEKIKYIDGILDAMIINIKAEMSRSNLKIADKTINKAIEIANNEGKDTYLGILYNLLGLVYYYTGNIYEAKKTYEKSIKAFQGSENSVEITKAMNNMANIYSDQQGNIEKAMKYYTEGLKICHKYGYIEVEKTFLFNIGIVYKKNCDYENAINYIEKAKELSIGLEDGMLAMFSIITLGQIYLDMGNYEKAYSYYIDIVEEGQNKNLQDIEVIGNYYNFLGRFNFKFGQWEEALYYTEKTIETCKEFRTEEYLDASSRLILIDYFYKNIYDKDSMEKVLEKYMDRAAYYDIRKRFLQFAAISYLEKDYEYVEELLIRDKKLKEKFSVEAIEFAKEAFLYIIDDEIGIENCKKENIGIIEEKFKGNNKQELQLYANIVLCQKFYKNENFSESLNCCLETLDIMYRLIAKVPSKKLQISFIKKYKGDLIKKRIENIINKMFSKKLNCIYLDDLVEDEKIEKYFDFSDLFGLIDDEEFDKIKTASYTDFSISREINNIEDLIKSFTTDYLYNFQLIIKYLGRETYAQEGFILIRDENTNEYNPVAILNNKDNVNESILWMANKNEKGLLIKNSFQNVEDKMLDVLLPSNMKALICVPIIRHESNNEDNNTNRRKKTYQKDKKIIGYIYLETNKLFNRFDEERLELVNTVAFLTFINIENYNLKILSTIDKMTGVFTRKYFDILFNEFLISTKRNGEKFSLLMLDIDKFKNINDIYGHRKGDEILSKIGRILNENTRKDDIVARYGGEEFIVVLKDINEKDAKAIAEKLREKVEKLNIPNGDSLLTISMGLVMYPRHGQFKEELIEKADQALYCAKERGRNRVITWHSNIVSTVNRVDRLAGIMSGNMVKDQRNVLAMMDMINLIRINTTKEEKICEFLGRLIEMLDSEYGILFIVDKLGIHNKGYARKRFETKWVKMPKVNVNVISRVVKTGKGEFLIDWETVSNVDIISGIPNWRSIIAIPLVYEGRIKGLVYLSVSMKEKEFDYNCYNLANALCGIFSAVI